VERSLDLGLLRDALAGRTNLPSAEQLQELMAGVEVQLFLRTTEIAQELWMPPGICTPSPRCMKPGRDTPLRGNAKRSSSAHTSSTWP
jgi:hypothetical protein